MARRILLPLLCLSSSLACSHTTVQWPDDEGLSSREAPATMWPPDTDNCVNYDPFEGFCSSVASKQPGCRGGQLVEFTVELPGDDPRLLSVKDVAAIERFNRELARKAGDRGYNLVHFFDPPRIELTPFSKSGRGVSDVSHSTNAWGEHTVTTTRSDYTIEGMFLAYIGMAVVYSCDPLPAPPVDCSAYRAEALTSSASFMLIDGSLRNHCEKMGVDCSNGIPQNVREAWITGGEHCVEPKSF